MARLGSLAAYRAQQRARAVGAGLVGKLSLGARIAALGDSIIQYGTTTNGTYSLIRHTVAGEIVWVNARNPRFRIDVWPDSAAPGGLFSGYNRGIAGQTSAQIAARVGDVVAMKPDACVVAAGTNDTTYDASTIASIRAICTALRAAGIRIILCTIRPWTASRPGSGDTQARRDTFGSANAAIRALAVEFGATLCDLAAAYGVPGEFSYADSSLLFDGLHPNAKGAQAGSIALEAAINSIVTSGNWPVSNLWSRPNLLTNPLLTGSGGTAGSGTTGSVPTSWSHGRGSGSYVSTAVLSRLSADPVSGSEGVNIDITTVVGADAEVFRFSQPAQPIAGLDAQWVQAFAEIDVDAAPYWYSHYLAVYNNSGTIIAEGMPFRNTSSINASEMRAARAGKLWISTPPMLVAAGTTGLGLKVEANFNPNAAAGAVLNYKIRRLWMGIVPDPRPLWNVAVA